MWSLINSGASQAFQAWLSPLRGLSPAGQIWATALPVTLFALLVFRLASNQAAIAATKERMKAFLLESWLFRDDALVTLRANGQVMRYSLVYLGYSLVPLTIMLVPMVLLIAEVESHFAFRSLAPGEPAILAVTLAPGTVGAETAARLELPAGLLQETPVLRLPGESRLLWRIRAVGPVSRPVSHEVRILTGGVAIARRVLVGPLPDAGLSPLVYRASDWRSLGSPAEPALAATGPAVTSELTYARARGHFAGLSSASWLLLGATLVLGFLLRRPFGVTF